jgi:hypothetical protein
MSFALNFKDVTHKSASKDIAGFATGSAPYLP